ncbi:MAG: hypothetical protein R3B96_10455 [Pirellulaceae bacterium]|nr:hypothetical protein [Planctomycetales bacterium]
MQRLMAWRLGARWRRCLFIALVGMLPLYAAPPALAAGEPVVWIAPSGPSYQVLRSSSQLQGSRSMVSPPRDQPAPAEPRLRRTYAYGWFGVSPRSHQQVKPSMYGLSQSYRWQ